MKKLLPLLLCLCVLLSAALPAYAGGPYVINGVTVAYTDFPSTSQECWTYAQNIYRKIWNTEFNSRFNTGDNLLHNLRDEELTLTVEHLKAYVSAAELGACLRICNTDCLHSDYDNIGHSQIIVQKDANGFTVFEGGLTGPTSREFYYTWGKYVEKSWLGGKYHYIKYIKWPGYHEYHPSYTVTYQANGGTNAPAAQTKVQGTTLRLTTDVPSRTNGRSGQYSVRLDSRGGSVSPSGLNAPWRSSYAFRNWNTKSDGTGQSYAPGDSYTQDQALTLYACWEETVTVEPVTLPTPVRTGYDFLGWSTDSGAATGLTGSYTPSGNVTLYALWRSKTYAVSYDANGGENAPPAQSKTHGTALKLSELIPTRLDTVAPSYTVTLDPCGGEALPALTAESRTRYTFAAWNSAADGSGARYMPDASYTANEALSLFAQWNGATETACVTLPKPTREGCFFLGWALNAGAEQADFQAGETLRFESSLTLCACWLDLNAPDCALPANLKSLEDEALAETPFRFVRLPEGMTAIGRRVFDGCGSLAYVLIPDSVTVIAEEAFDGAPAGLTVLALPGSEAERFAAEHSLYVSSP